MPKIICLVLGWFSDCRFEFGVKGETDAHVLLSSCRNCDGYEIVIGGWSNTKSAIRDGKQKTSGQLLVNTPNILGGLSSTTYSKFWIDVNYSGSGKIIR